MVPEISESHLVSLSQCPSPCLRQGPAADPSQPVPNRARAAPQFRCCLATKRILRASGSARVPGSGTIRHERFGDEAWTKAWTKDCSSAAWRHEARWRSSSRATSNESSAAAAGRRTVAAHQLPREGLKGGRHAKVWARAVPAPCHYRHVVAARGGRLRLPAAGLVGSEWH